MSWWNTSNITSLASKALKNAQKKIDEALDISEQAAQGTAATGSGAIKKEKKEKDEFWSGWSIGDADTKEQTSPKSSWSFPWGAGAEGGEGTEEIREKTAEEIKTEVLKAAKERTKAKSKLFPSKEKKDEEPFDETGNVNIQDTGTEKVEVKTEVALKSEITDSADESNVPSEFSCNVSGKPDKIFQSDDVTESLGVLGINDSVKDDTNVLDLQQIPVDSVTPIESSDSEIKGISSKQEATESVAQLEVSDSQTITTSLSGNFLSSSGDIHINDAEIVSNDTVKDSSFQELTVDTGAQFENSEFQSLDRSSSGSDLLQISESKTEVLLEASSESKTELPIETGLKTEKEILPDVQPMDETVTGKTVEDENNLYELSCDVSSSVEIITEKDIPVIENDKTEEQSDHIAEKDVKTTEESFSESDKNVISDQVTDADASQIEAFSVIDKGKSETSEEPDSISSEQVEDDDVTCSPKEIDLHETDLQESGSSFVNLSQQELAARCESDSSINTLDVSLDTCTSEETVIDEGLSSSGTSETMKEKTPADTAEVSNVEAESNRTCGASPNISAEQSEVIDTEQVGLVVESASNESQGFTNEETSDGSESGERAELSPANSFVKCTLEDAMEESKGDDNSDNHSGTEKSDGSRSIHSGHESADEIDTTTSSDIEIISLPTPNGENRQVSPLDPVQLRIGLQKTGLRGSPTHRRSDSSGSSANSRDGHTELSPGRDHIEYPEYSRSSYAEPKSHDHYEDNSKFRQSELPALDEEDDNPYHPQRLLKEGNKMEESHDVTHDNDSMSHDTTADYEQKLAEMAEVLQAREDKLLQLSKDNCDLVEANSILTNQLKQSEESREAEMTDLNELTAEFTQRLTDSEKRISAAIKEKDQYKRQLQAAQSELAKKAADTSLQSLLEEKEEQIQGLLQEGEKLSKSQLQSNTIIKKLRSKEKDNESTITTQKKKLESQKDELDHLKKVLDTKEETEKKQTEALSQLQTAVSKQETEIARLKSDYEDTQEKTRGLQAALDNSYKELAELHRSSAVQDSKAQEAALSAEMTVREELKMTIEKQQQQHKWEKDSLLMQIEDLRMSMARMEKESNRREDMLKQEISDLQKHLQEDEARTQELTQNVSSATRPLLRQIENLQSTYTAQSSTWEKVEKNLADRLADTQNQLAMSAEKERTANDQVLDLGSKVTSLEAQNTRLRQEKSQLTAQLEMLKTKVELTEETKQNEAAQIELLKNQLNQEITDLKKQKVLLETQLDIEKSKLEQEKKKVGLLQEQIRDLEREASRSRGTPSRGTPSPVSISRQESFASSFHEQSFTSITQDEIDRSFYLQSAGGSKQSLYEALRQSGAANLLENLQSQLKLREGEITHLQSEIHQLERTRESMAKELVNLSNANDDLQEQVKELPVLREQYKEMDHKYDALLQMYGEKVEETNELRLDLADVKEMYKAQINHLLSNQ